MRVSILLRIYVWRRVWMKRLPWRSHLFLGEENVKIHGDLFRGGCILKDQYKKKKTIKVGKHRIEHWHIIAFFLMVYDFAAVCASYFLALLLRFMFRTRKSEKISLDFA
jgi:hypothetical protein